MGCPPCKNLILLRFSEDGCGLLVSKLLGLSEEEEQRRDPRTGVEELLSNMLQMQRSWVFLWKKKAAAWNKKEKYEWVRELGREKPEVEKQAISLFISLLYKGKNRKLKALHNLPEDSVYTDCLV